MQRSIYYCLLALLLCLLVCTLSLHRQQKGCLLVTPSNHNYLIYGCLPESLTGLHCKYFAVLPSGSLVCLQHYKPIAKIKQLRGYIVARGFILFIMKNNITYLYINKRTVRCRLVHGVVRCGNATFSLKALL